MKYRKMGRTGIQVSEISLGSWLTYGGSTEKSTAIETIHKAYDLGINFFDTANVYIRGEAEKVVGEALRNYPRESYVLATKVFWPMGEGPNDRGLSRKHIMEQCHGSLKRLGVDNVDIYYCHRYDIGTPLDETLRAFEDLVTQGKVHYIGISEWTAAQIEQGIGLAEKHLWNRIVVNQPVYNMLNRYIEKEVIPVSEKNGISQVVFSPLAQGVLTGKYKPGMSLPAGSRATDPNSNMHMGSLLQHELLLKVEKLDTIARQMGIRLSQLAIAWILRQSNVCSALVGATRIEQIVENAAASGIELSSEVLSEIEVILTS